MANENKPDQLEMEKIKLERLKVYGKIITVLISVGIGTFGVSYINHIIQEKRLEGQLKQEEMKYLGEFLENALVDDYNKRLRFAEYFATLTISPDLQKKWENYRDGIIQNQKILEEKKVKLAEIIRPQAEEGKVDLEWEELTAEIARLQAQAAPLPEKSDVYLSYERVQRFLLDENQKPRNYTENKFEVQKDGKVIYDKATGLIWQQSGSEKKMEYNEAHNYIRQLNQKGFAGYSDWRLPTLKEAMTLLKPAKTNNNLFIDPVFDNKQWHIWTSDLSSALSSAWFVDFITGCCLSSLVFDYDFFVRAVR